MSIIFVTMQIPNRIGGSNSEGKYWGLFLKGR